MRNMILTITLILITTTGSAQTLSGQAYILENPRIVVSGGQSGTEQYSLDSVNIGNITGGRSQSSLYSLDATEAAVKSAEPTTPTDTTPPTITEITPIDGSIKELNTTIYITCTAEDNSGLLEYQFKIDNQIVQPWAPDFTYNWNTQNLSSGVYQIVVEVKDESDNTTVSNIVEIYLIKRLPGMP
jgi:hypothetical protein